MLTSQDSSPAREDRQPSELTSVKLPIVLIGPLTVGKTTVGKLLAAQLELPFIDLWEAGEKYWQEVGYDRTLEKQAWENNRVNGVYHYMMPFEAQAIKRGVPEYHNCVIELGASQSVYDDAELFQQVSRVLQPHNVVLLLPSEDVEQSLQILEERTSIKIEGLERNEYFLRHRSNYDLAKYTFYTKDQTPEETSEEILAQIDPKASEIVLIGPMGAGKSTIGKLLAQKLGLPQVSMDRLRFDYYTEAGWGPEQQKQTFENEGKEGYYRRWKQFRLQVVERILNEHHNCVIDFGCGYSVYEDDRDLERARQLLSPYKNVLLLLPSPDLDESVAILRQRNTPTINDMEANRFLITHPSNRELAKLVVYTEGQTPVETRDEILERLELTHR